MFFESNYVYNVLLSLFLLVLGYFGLPWLSGRWMRIVLKRRCVRQGCIMLTFDDGPGSRLTLQVLDILQEQGCKAIFFLLGRNIKGHENIVRKIAANGHTICSHGFDHLNAWKVWPWKSCSDIRKGWEAINSALETEGQTFAYRPPYGKINTIVQIYLWCKRVPIIYWTHDSKDTGAWRRGQPSVKLMSQQLCKGAVLLMHDFDRVVDDRDTYVLDTVRTAIDVAHINNLNISTLKQADIKHQCD